MSEQGSDAPSESPVESDKQAKLAEEEEEETQVAFSSYQLFVIVSCYFGYCIMLFNRKAFTFTLPHIIVEEYISSQEVSMILGAQTLSYTISKFFASWATDHISPRIMLVTGLFLTGFVMLAFADQEDWPNIMMLTFANGLAQGLGWPAVTKMVRAWFPPIQFGLWYAVLSSASNMVGTIGPGIATTLAVMYGWRSSLQIPAFIAIVASVCIYFCSWDKPSDMGYEDQLTMFGTATGHWSDLAGSEFMTLLSTISFLLFLVKASCQDWGQQYLLQERGLTAFAAGSYLTSMEIGGLVGSLFVGMLSDYMVRRGYYFGTDRSPRMVLVQLCVAGSALFLNLFIFGINADTSQTYMRLLGFQMGFCMYGAISLVTTIAIEVAPIHMTGSALAVVGLAGNCGAVAAGVPLSYIALNWDWFTAFMGINLLCVLAFMIVIAGKDVKASYIQKGGGPAKLKFA